MKKRKKSEYERGFANGVNCRCAVCSEQRKRLRAASRKLKNKPMAETTGREGA